MLYQFQWENKHDRSREFVAQTEIDNNLTQREFDRELEKFIEEVKANHQMPEDCIAVICDETSDSFFMQKAE